MKFQANTRERNGKIVEKSKQNQGITLLVLVVTIVVILILAGITVNIAFQDNGIIKKAQGLQETVNQSVAKDEEAMNKLAEEIASGTISGGGGLVPDTNSIGGGEEPGNDTTVPSKPKVEIIGTKGNNEYYRS